MNLETNLFPMSQGDQGHPSLCGSSPALTSCLMAHQEVLWSQLILPSVITMTFEKKVGSSHVQASQFDSDSQMPMVDDGTSACITTDKNDFIGTSKTISRKVNGINGQAQATHRGPVRWLIEDDKGMTYVLTINGAYLVPAASTRILSPQHLAKDRRHGFHHIKQEHHVVLESKKAYQDCTTGSQAQCWHNYYSSRS